MVLLHIAIIVIYLRIDKSYTIYLRFISQFANYDHREKTRFFFKLLLILPIHKLATKRDTLFVTNSSVKAKFPYSFTTSRLARLYT